MKRKELTLAVKEEPRRPRKKRVVKKLPAPYRAGMAVKVSNPYQFKGYRLGVITGPCPKDDGIRVYLTASGDIAEYTCVDINLGCTIESISKDDSKEDFGKGHTETIDS